MTYDVKRALSEPSPAGELHQVIVTQSIDPETKEKVNVEIELSVNVRDGFMYLVHSNKTDKNFPGGQQSYIQASWRLGDNIPYDQTGMITEPKNNIYDIRSEIQDFIAKLQGQNDVSDYIKFISEDHTRDYKTEFLSRISASDDRRQACTEKMSALMQLMAAYTIAVYTYPGYTPKQTAEADEINNLANKELEFNEARILLKMLQDADTNKQPEKFTEKAIDAVMAKVLSPSLAEKVGRAKLAQAAIENPPVLDPGIPLPPIEPPVEALPSVTAMPPRPGESNN
jgi:hypothetical protein